MNKRLLRLALLGVVGAVFPLQVSVTRAAQKNTGEVTKDEFFIVSSLNPRKHEIVLKLPSEVTLQMTVTGKTTIVDDHGKTLKVSDLRSGDTAYISYARNGNEVDALKIRLGPMTVQELRRRYLNQSPAPIPQPAAPSAPGRSPRPTRRQRGQAGR